MCIKKIFDKLFKKVPAFRNKQKKMLINSMSALISVEMSKRLKPIEDNGEDNKRFYYTEKTLGALKDLSDLLSKKFKPIVIILIILLLSLFLGYTKIYI